MTKWHNEFTSRLRKIVTTEMLQL